MMISPTESFVDEALTLGSIWTPSMHQAALEAEEPIVDEEYDEEEQVGDILTLGSLWTPSMDDATLEEPPIEDEENGYQENNKEKDLEEAPCVSDRCLALLMIPLTIVVVMLSAVAILALKHQHQRYTDSRNNDASSNSFGDLGGPSFTGPVSAPVAFSPVATEVDNSKDENEVESSPKQPTGLDHSEDEGETEVVVELDETDEAETSVEPDHSSGTNTTVNTETGLETNITQMKPDEPDAPLQSEQQPDEQVANLFQPGNLNTEPDANGLYLSVGLQARLIASSGTVVDYTNRDTPPTQSTVVFHDRPDSAAVFDDPSLENPGGWIYVSNSEMNQPGMGGVGALYFDKEGQVREYKLIMRGSTMNGGGGRTPWNTWISCEETPWGTIWQIDPSGVRAPERIALANGRPARYESFAFDESRGHYFVTEDHRFGTVRKWIPTSRTGDWTELNSPGSISYLELNPQQGTYAWTTLKENAQQNANAYYRNPEGIIVDGNMLSFVSEQLQKLFVLDLATNKYTHHSAAGGLFDGRPDQLTRLSTQTDESQSNSVLFFTEDGGSRAGIHVRSKTGNFTTILEGPTPAQAGSSESNGLAFSPNRLYMYVAFQMVGKVFAVSRKDGLPFDTEIFTHSQPSSNTTVPN